MMLRAVTVAGSLLNKDKKYTQVILEQVYDAFRDVLDLATKNFLTIEQAH
jgi:hypothetical protein